MSEKTFTTGYVAGLVICCYKTLYRYVKEYPEFFSDTAKKTTRGRRWTEDDLKIIEAIHYLRRLRAGNEDIKDLLADGWRPENVGAYDANNISRLLEQTLLYVDGLNQYYQEAEKLVKEAKENLSWSNNLHQKVRSLELNYWEIRQELRRVRYLSRAPHAPSRREDFYWEWQSAKKEFLSLWELRERLELVLEQLGAKVPESLKNCTSPDKKYE